MSLTLFSAHRLWWDLILGFPPQPPHTPSWSTDPTWNVITQCFPKCVPWTTCFGITWMRVKEEEERKVMLQIDSWAGSTQPTKPDWEGGDYGELHWKSLTQWILIYRTVYEPQQEQDCLRGSQILSLSRPCSKGQRPPTPNTCPVWSLGHTLTQIMETLQPITFSSKSRGCVLSHEWEQGKLGEAAGPMLWLKGQLLLHSSQLWLETSLVVQW